MSAKLRRLRYVGPLILATACLVVASYVSPLLSYLLVLACFALVFDVATAWFAHMGGSGGLKDYRQ